MALTVEDGTGLAAADAYVDVAFVDAYAAAYGETSWTGSSDTAAKEVAIRQAARWSDLEYQTRWRGAKFLQAQALDWPRERVYVEGFYLPTNTLPEQLKQANAVLSIQALADGTLFAVASTATGSAVKRTKKQIGPLLTETEYVAGADASQKQFDAVDALVRPLLRPGGGAEVVRA